jgi:hypothetical protein
MSAGNERVHPAKSIGEITGLDDRDRASGQARSRGRIQYNYRERGSGFHSARHLLTIISTAGSRDDYESEETILGQTAA